jgi:hypothetical protein
MVFAAAVLLALVIVVSVVRRLRLNAESAERARAFSQQSALLNGAPPSERPSPQIPRMSSSRRPPARRNIVPPVRSAPLITPDRR